MDIGSYMGVKLLEILAEVLSRNSKILILSVAHWAVISFYPMKFYPVGAVWGGCGRIQQTRQAEKDETQPLPLRGGVYETKSKLAFVSACVRF